MENRDAKMTKEIGKIENCWFGFGGYQNTMFGVGFILSGKAWGVGDFWGTWGDAPGKDAKWTRKTQSKHFGSVVLRVHALCVEAGVKKFEDLKGKPIEAIFENDRLQSWRILTEVF